MTLTRADFVGVMKNAISGLGLGPDAAMVTFPIELFLPGSDIAPVEARKREFYDGLTRWTSDLAGDAGGEIPMVSVRGATFEDALVRANNLMIANLWGDGLPLWPATRERVEWILRGSTLPRAHVLGTFPPRGGVATVELCAIALAMAGGRPEYLPVLLAAVDAFLDPDSGSEQLQAASGSAFPVVIVNGPIGRQIRLNSGFGCLGPDPQRPAGASIGRALRLMQQNVGGARPGVGTMANYGGLRYTNVVFAEDEDNLPAGWPAHGDGPTRLRTRAQLDLARLRERRHQYPAARRQEGDARGGRAPGHAPHGGLHACAQSGGARRLRARHARHPDDSRRGGPDHGRPRLDQALDARVPLGALADPGRAPAPRRRPRVDRDRRECRDTSRA